MGENILTLYDSADLKRPLSISILDSDTLGRAGGHLLGSHPHRTSPHPPRAVTCERMRSSKDYSLLAVLNEVAGMIGGRDLDRIPESRCGPMKFVACYRTDILRIPPIDKSPKGGHPQNILPMDRRTSPIDPHSNAVINDTTFEAILS